MEDLFDDHYTRSFLKNVPKYVRRTMKLPSLIVRQVPSAEVRLYLREAGRNYVFGHWMSCIALARAALETSLCECIQTVGVTPDRELRALIETAGRIKLLDGRHQQLASLVQRTGNAIVHGTANQQPKDQTSFDMLVALRGVLLHLYHGAAPGLQK